MQNIGGEILRWLSLGGSKPDIVTAVGLNLET